MVLTDFSIQTNFYWYLTVTEQYLDNAYMNDLINV